ncbi:MAG: AsmA-like C-terminal region-containing protein [Vicinamibacterales bacterium]
MIKKLAVGLVVLVLVLGVGGFFWARSVLGTDAVRTALADQLSKALGQPVTVEGVSATIYPRVTVTLTGVSIGKAGEITVNALDVGTDFGALLSRRIEHAALHVNQAKVQLPLPPLALGSGTSAPADAGSPVELVSIDEVVLSGIELVSRGRTLRGDIDIVPRSTTALTVRRVSLTADSARIDATGEITNTEGPAGTLDIKAGAIDLDQLLAFASDFVEGSGATAPAGGGAPAGAAPGPSTADLTVNLTADRATMAGVTLDTVNGRARIKGDDVSVEPMTFELFGGTYEGALGANIGAAPAFSWKAALKNVDVAAVTAFAGSPGLISGRLAATIDLTGTGIDAASAMKTARGTATLAIQNGSVKNLALVRSAVAATSLNPQAVIAAAQGQPVDEPFSELGASLSIANGTASTPDLHFVSKDIRLDAGGALKLDGSAVNLQGAVQLSDALTQQANPAIVRVLQQDGKITLPATVRGNVDKYQIEIDTSQIAKRAITNEAKTQATEAVKRGLGGLLRR